MQGSTMSQIEATYRGDESKLLLVFTCMSGYVDEKKLRRFFSSQVLTVFEQINVQTSKHLSLGVQTYSFDVKVNSIDRYHWIGDKKQNTSFIVKYSNSRNRAKGSSINEVYRTALRKINEHASTRKGRKFETYIMVVCDGGTEDFDGAPEINVWQAEMKELVSKLKAKNVVFLLAGAADLPWGERPRVPQKDRRMGKFFLLIHEEMWRGYSDAKGFYSLNTDIQWFVKKLIN